MNPPLVVTSEAPDRIGLERALPPAWALFLLAAAAGAAAFAVSADPRHGAPLRWGVALGAAGFIIGSVKALVGKRALSFDLSSRTWSYESGWLWSRPLRGPLSDLVEVHVRGVWAPASASRWRGGGASREPDDARVGWPVVLVFRSQPPGEVLVAESTTRLLRRREAIDLARRLSRALGAPAFDRGATPPLPILQEGE